MENINMLLYMFLAILCCKFIKGVKIFTIIMSFLTNKQKLCMSLHLKHISYHIIHFCDQIKIKLREIQNYSELSKAFNRH